MVSISLHICLQYNFISLEERKMFVILLFLTSYLYAFVKWVIGVQKAR